MCKDFCSLRHGPWQGGDCVWLLSSFWLCVVFVIISIVCGFCHHFDCVWLLSSFWLCVAFVIILTLLRTQPSHLHNKLEAKLPGRQEGVDFLDVRHLLLPLPARQEKCQGDTCLGHWHLRRQNGGRPRIPISVKSVQLRPFPTQFLKLAHLCLG